MRRITPTRGSGCAGAVLGGGAGVIFGGIAPLVAAPFLKASNVVGLGPPFYLLFIGMIGVALGGVGGAAIGFIAADRWQRGQVPPDDHEHKLRSEGPQLVGESCVRCGTRVVSELDAEFCASCGRAVHGRCKTPGSRPDQCPGCGAAVAHGGEGQGHP